MTLKETKTAILKHRDFFGGDIPQIDEIKKARSKKRLKEILDEHGTHLEMVAVDAQSHHSRFKHSLGLHLI